MNHPDNVNNDPTNRGKSKTSWDKILVGSVLLVGLIVIGIIAITQVTKDRPVDTVSDTQSDQSNPTPHTYKLGETAKAGQFNVIVKDSKIESEIKTTNGTEKTENQFVIIPVIIASESDKPRDISSNMFRLVDDKGRSYEAYKTSSTLQDGTAALTYETINPGISRTKYIAFETPKGTKPVAVNVEDGVALAQKTTVQISLTK